MMPAVLSDATEARRAKSLESRVDEIEADVTEERGDFCSNLASVVVNCASLAKQWRAAVSRYSRAMQCDKELDYRSLRGTLLPIAVKTQNLYRAVEALAKEADAGVVPPPDRADLTLAIIEAKNVREWLETWPSQENDRRADVESAIAIGEECSDEEFLAMEPLSQGE